jgi:hypothetical protein
VAWLCLMGLEAFWGAVSILVSNTGSCLTSLTGEEGAAGKGSCSTFDAVAGGKSGKASELIAEEADADADAAGAGAGAGAGALVVGASVGSAVVSSLDSAALRFDELRDRADLCIDLVRLTDWPRDIEEAWSPSWAGSRWPSSCSWAEASARSCWAKMRDWRHASSPQ